MEKPHWKTDQAQKLDLKAEDNKVKHDNDSEYSNLTEEEKDE